MCIVRFLKESIGTVGWGPLQDAAFGPLFCYFLFLLLLLFDSFCIFLAEIVLLLIPIKNTRFSEKRNKDTKAKFQIRT